MAIAFVNATSTFAVGSSGTIASSAFALTAGNTVVVAIRNVTVQNEITGIIDTAGNVYRLAGTAISSGCRHDVWYCTNCLGNATNVVTATFAAADTGRGIAVAQFSGLATISPLDVCVSNDKTVASADITSPSFTTAVANCVVVACAQKNVIGGNAWSPDTGYAEATEDSDNVQQIQYQIFSVIQTGVTVTAVNANTTTKSLIVISLHETLTSGGGGEHSSVF